MRFKWFFLSLAFSFLLFPAFILSAKNSISATDDQSSPEETAPLPTFTPLPRPTSTPLPEAALSLKSAKSFTTVKALIIHKPMPSPSWGKVIQYHRDQVFALTDKNREILHEFLFQDEDGVVRTAVFHENAEGNGYWEVWVWDQQ